MVNEAGALSIAAVHRKVSSLANKPHELLEFCDLLEGVLGSAELKAWCEAFPSSSLPLPFIAENLKEYAWDARGDGYASSVSRKAWRRFNDRMNRAKCILDADKGLSDVSMIHFALAQLSIYQGITEIPMVERERAFNAVVRQDPQNWKAHWLIAEQKAAK